MRQPIGTLTARAVDILMQSVADPEANYRQHINLDTILNIRDSTRFMLKK
jgi:DNA-binding LacI/PurR family transcriptional regulator